MVAFLGLSRKLCQKGGTAKRKAEKALTEVNTNTRTIAISLLSQNKEYEAKISELRLLIDEKNEEQREEIKALKDAILFPDVMNSQLQVLPEKQGIELKQAKQVSPCLKKQVTSLTGQLQCLAEDLAEVKVDKYTSRTCFDEHLSSPRTPISDREAANPFEYRSPDCMASGYGCQGFKSLSDSMLFKIEAPDDRSFQQNAQQSPNTFCSSHGGMLSKSSERCL
ncbi:hypothetical protein MUK42_02389, partial [Musa troglodytarum]